MSALVAVAWHQTTSDLQDKSDIHVDHELHSTRIVLLASVLSHSHDPNPAGHLNVCLQMKCHFPRLGLSSEHPANNLPTGYVSNFVLVSTILPDVGREIPDRRGPPEERGECGRYCDRCLRHGVGSNQFHPFLGSSKSRVESILVLPWFSPSNGLSASSRPPLVPLTSCQVYHSWWRPVESTWLCLGPLVRCLEWYNLGLVFFWGSFVLLAVRRFILIRSFPLPRMPYRRLSFSQ